MISVTTILLVLMISGLSQSANDGQLSYAAFDLFLKALIKTFQTPITDTDTTTQLSVEIILANDVFNLDDILRLFIQQYILALYNNHYHLMPDDWETRYSAYSGVIKEINNLLDLLGRRKLSEISVKDIRPFVKSLTPKALKDLQRLIKYLEDEAMKEEENDSDTPSAINDEL